MRIFQSQLQKIRKRWWNNELRPYHKRPPTEPKRQPLGNNRVSKAKLRNAKRHAKNNARKKPHMQIYGLIFWAGAQLSNLNTERDVGNQLLQQRVI